MKKLFLLAGLMVGSLGWTEGLDLNGSWEFRFEEGRALAEVAKADFAATDVIPVPGCYDTMPKWFMKRGTGLYRRTFTLDRAVPNAWLTVEGMGLVGLFMLDGRALGTKALPYSRLRFETGPLAAGTHTVFAALDNRFDWRQLKIARPYYDFYLYGGFYHGVSLDFDNRSLRVRTRDYRTGVVEVELVGEDVEGEQVLLFDGRNEVKAAFKDNRATVKVPGFRLWSPETPNLHTVALKSKDAGRPAPTARFGIRTIEARDKRLWLNGELLYLKGANRHEAHPTFGSATSEALMLQDIQNLKALGGNFFRGAHYPQSQRFLDLCDENGVLVWEESLGWGNGQPWVDPERKELKDRQFQADQLEQTKLMVENSFNHPSVIIFAFLNEFESSEKGWKDLADRMIDAVKSYDSGRLVSFACNHNSSDICNEKTDIISFNTYPGWIGSDPGEPDNLKRLFKEDVDAIVKYHRKRYGDKPIMVSEMGTCGEYGRHDAAGAQWTEEFEAEYVCDAIETVFANPEIAGFTIWQFTDCRSFHRGGGTVRTKPFAENLAGLYDGYRRPKLVVTSAVKKAFEKSAAGEKPIK